MSTKLYIGGLSFDSTEDELREFFEAVGPVESASIVTDRYSGRSRGFGFVEMSSADARKAIEELNGKTLGGRTISVEEARPPQRSGGGGGFRRGGGGGGGGFQRRGGGGGRRW
ncbi:MAG: RNA-binding protein [Chloroflexi bacterium]|nr:RNA-binding protein [Chloroflexota bacterium]